MFISLNILAVLLAAVIVFLVVLPYCCVWWAIYTLRSDLLAYFIETDPRKETKFQDSEDDDEDYDAKQDQQPTA